MTEITNAYNCARKIPFDNDSKFIIMSDVHRGTGDKSDDFIKNKNLFYDVLQHYYTQNYVYIELGDGEELWENRNINKIINANIEIYLLLQKFYNADKLYLIYGNHDMEKQSQKYVEENLYKYYDEKSKSYKKLLDGMKVYESILLSHKKSKGKVFLIHGHQVDFFNNKLWYFARFLLRYLWKPLEHIGIQDPTRPAKSKKRKLAVEKRLTEWIADNNQMLIAGHTHKPVFSDIGIPPYFNDGSCVRKNKITAIEIENGEISLVKWKYRVEEKGGKKEYKETVAGPVKIEKYF